MRTAYLSKTSMTVPLGRIPMHGYEQDTDYVLNLDLVTDANIPEAVLIANVDGWAKVSKDGGSNYYDITTDRTTSYDLGARVAGTRLAIKIKINIASSTTVRQRFLSFIIGIGVG